MAPEPRDYDREFRKPLPGPLQLRIGLTTSRGDVTRFMVQLEYWLDGEYRTVVRYDHDGEGIAEQAHDAEKEPLHMDVYRDGERVDTERVTGPISADEALTTPKNT